MKEFVSNLMTKLNKKVLCIFAAALGVLAFVVGILTICNSAKNGVGTFINYLVAAIMLFVLSYEIYKENKKKSVILIFAIIAEFIFLSGGYSIQHFVMCGDLAEEGFSGLTITISVFDGLADLALFVAGIAVLIATLNDNVKKDNCHFIADCAFLVSAILFFVVGILDLCQSGKGMNLAISFMIALFYAGQAVFFAFETNNVLMQNEEANKPEVKEEAKEAPKEDK